MEKMKKQTMETQVALILQDVGNIKENMNQIKNKLDNDYVTVEEFRPVKSIAYGAIKYATSVIVGLLLVIGILVSIVITRW